MNQEFREFARSRAAPLHRAAYLLCGDWHLADDIVQETLVKTYRHWSRVRRAENADAYVRRILVNETNRHWKRQRFVAVPAEQTSDDPVQLDDVGRAIDRIALLRALENLTPRQRATVVLRYFEGFSERDTAEALGYGGHRQEPDISGVARSFQLLPTSGDQTMKTELEDRLGQALQDLAADRDFAVDLDTIERRGRRTKRRAALTGGGVTLTVAAVVATAVGIGSVGSNPTPKVSAAAPAVTPLARLADYVLASATQPAGDATKVIRTSTLTGQVPTVGADLFADDGDYFYADDPAGLPARVKAHENLANGVFGRDVAIAQFAANGGDLVTAQKRMAGAALDPGTPYDFVAGEAPSPFPPGATNAQKKAYDEEFAASKKTPVLDFDDTWSNSLDALIAGAGRPEVRAGVVKILSTLPTVTVTNTTTDGRPTLTVSNTEVLSSSTYVETLIIGAKDGVPVRLTGGDKGKPIDVTVAYQVSRVTLSDLG